MRLLPPSIVAVLALGFVALACTTTLDPSLTELEVGDCVKNYGQQEVERLDTVDCDDPGAFIVASTFEVTGHTSFPGDIELQRIAVERCSLESTNWLVPTEESWEEADDRLIVCFEEDPYFIAIIDISIEQEDDFILAFAAVGDEIVSCDAGSVSACDRVIETFGGMSDSVVATRSRVETLSPPEHVTGWHAEYLALLQDFDDALNSFTTAYFAGDLAELDRASIRLDLVIQQEGELLNQFDERRFE